MEIARTAGGHFAPGHAPHPKAGRPRKRRVIEVMPSNMAGCCQLGGLDGIDTASNHELALAERATTVSILALTGALSNVIAEFTRVRLVIAAQRTSGSPRLPITLRRLGNLIARELNESVAEGAYGHRLSFIDFDVRRGRGADAADFLNLPDGPPDVLDAELELMRLELEAELATEAQEESPHADV